MRLRNTSDSLMIFVSLFFFINPLSSFFLTIPHPIHFNVMLFS
jgi:hypothetical protein